MLTSQHSALLNSTVFLNDPSLETRYRQTKIVFTIGPATSSDEVLKQLIEEQVDICRLNMAHGDHAWTRATVRQVKRVCQETGRHIAILMDIKGPEIRTGDVGDPLYLEQGELFEFLMERSAERISPDGVRGVDVNYPGLANDVAVADRVLVDSGLIHMEVVTKQPDRIRCRVLIPGVLGNRRHINLPGVRVGLPSLTDKDRADIEVGLEEGVDFYALSFVRDAAAIEDLRSLLGASQSKARIIAKIEDQQGIANLDAIIEASDGVMVARGDLGIECPYEELPIIQHQIIKACIRKSRPVIVATHMLESMIEAPVPTRAEVSDVAHAVLEKADAIMLSGETTTGKYPVECVRVFKRIARRIESVHDDEPTRELALPTPKGKMLRSAVYLANDIQNSGIVVFSRSGYLVRMLSSLRPKVPIYAFTDIPALFRHLLILWGVEPFQMTFSENPEDTLGNALDYLKRRNWVTEGQHLVVISNALASGQVIDTLQIRTVQ
ncbi:pyruvate kinase [Methylotetracoccus oryzae]|uniref:pyruvate kinase n=1 Tax=Methylotetracoccus oryzae TaxID=1919059 RepID=UPI001118864C|nr:pyruvate kinase [Methylotetracoccus oryzae]